MDHVTVLVERYYGSLAGMLHVGGIPISDIAADCGTPFFVYDSSVLSQKLRMLRSALPAEFSISYSVKANPIRHILKFFVENECGLEIASSGELCQALSAACPPQKIVFAGPGKTEAELELALTKGVGELHAESILEVERIGKLCRILGVRGRVALRVNPGAEAQGGAMRMGGKSVQFGIDEEILDDVLDRVLADKCLEFSGIHLFVGTQILDHAVLTRQYRKGVEIARRVATRVCHPLQTLDLGGGLGIPYFSSEGELDLRQFHDELSSLMTELRVDPLFSGTRFMVEPGRYLVGEAGTYVARINDVKISRGKKFLILDGGMNHHLAASGNLGQVIKRNFPLAIINRLGDTVTERVDIVGPLCTPLDTLARDVDLPCAKVGDLVGIFQSGAYARSASPLGFLSHPAPPETWVEKGKVSIICPRGK